MSQKEQAKKNQDYEVGYRKPPKSGQFKKGQSGNPKGRAPGSRGLKTDLKAALKERTTIRANGLEIKGSRQQVMLHTLALRAASGDVRATKLLTDLIISTLGVEDEGKARQRLSAAEDAALNQLMSDGLMGLLEYQKSGSDSGNIKDDEPNHANGSLDNQEID